MTKFKKLAFLALVPLFAFFSCKNESELYDYVQKSKSPELSIVGNSVTGKGDSYVLDLTNSLPGKADGEFTVYVKNSKPSNIVLKSTAKKVTFTQGSIEETTAEDSVGAGAYKMKVSYAVAQNLELQEDETSLSFDFTVFAQFTSEDAISKKVNFNVSYVAADSSLALTNFEVSDRKEHVFTLTWTNPSGIEFKSMDYVVYLLTTSSTSSSSESSGEGEESATKTIKTQVESGSLEANATSLTTTTSLTAKSNYYVEITALSSNAWYTTGTDGVSISTTDDITPPNAPKIALSSSAEDSITLKYTKGDSSDDTATLLFSIATVASDKTETTVTNATISATVGTSTVTYSSTDGLDVSDVEANAELEIVISGLARSKTETSYKITVHAKDALGNDSAQTSGIVNDEDNRNTEISASTVADTVAPVLSSVSVSNGTSSAKISWTEPSDSDFAGVKIMSGDTELTKVLKGTAYYALTGLSADTTYTLYAYDTVGNEQSTGVEAKVELASLKPSAKVKYTGSILVTWDDITDYDSSGNEVTYTYSVSGTSSGTDTVTSKTSIAQGTQKALFSGLTVGNTYTFTMSFVLNGTTTVAKATASETARQVVYIKSATPNTQCGGATKYLVDSLNYNSSGIGIGAYIVGTSDDAYKNCKETKWIVMPGLSDPSDPDQVSFASYTTSGKYLQISTLTVDTSVAAGTTSATTIGVKGEPFDWGYSNEAPTSYPLLMVDTPTTDDGKKYASFTKSAADSNGNFSLALVYEIASGSTYYLAGHTYRACAETSTTNTTDTGSAWNTPWYNYKWSFVDVTE